MILFTVLAVLGCAGTGVLWGLLCWVRREYGLETAAMSRIIKDQKSYTDLLCDECDVIREKIADHQADVAERDKMIGGLVTRIECLEKLHQAKCQELAARNLDLIEMRNKAREIVSTAFAHDPASDSGQPQKPLCDN